MSFVGTHARGDEDALYVRLIHADMAEDADHALHGKNTRAGSELFAQIFFRSHRLGLLCAASSSFLTSSTSCKLSKRSAGISSLICSGILMSSSKKFFMPSDVGRPGTPGDKARR